MELQVIDTNVLVAANGADTHAGRSCQLACARRLSETKNNDVLVLDSDRYILGEYQRNMPSGASNSPAYLFFTWASRTTPRLLINLTPHDTRTFAQFPSNPLLGTFDEDDRKFVAAATVAQRTGPTVLVNALDRDYSEHGDALRREGIRVDELCPQHIGSRS